MVILPLKMKMRRSKKTTDLLGLSVVQVSLPKGSESTNLVQLTQCIFFAKITNPYTKNVINPSDYLAIFCLCLKAEMSALAS